MFVFHIISFFFPSTFNGLWKLIRSKLQHEQHKQLLLPIHVIIHSKCIMIIFRQVLSTKTTVNLPKNNRKFNWKTTVNLSKNSKKFNWKRAANLLRNSRKFNRKTTKNLSKSSKKFNPKTTTNTRKSN